MVLWCAGLITVCLLVVVVRYPTLGAPARTSPAPRALYLYGHSWTTGYGLPTTHGPIPGWSPRT